MTDSADLPAGARIAMHRKLGQLTQHGLASRANVSYSLLTKVESGDRPASPALIAACARALGVEASALTGEPPVVEDQDRLRGLLAVVRTQLDLYDLDPDESVQPRGLEALRAAVREVNIVGQAARYEPMAALLPGLLSELHTAAHRLTGTARHDAWGLLAEAYRCGHTVGIAVGQPELSLTALSRMDWAAQRAGDRAPGLRAAREYLRVTAYLRQHDYQTCWALNAAGRAHLSGTDPKTPGVIIASGQLHLGAAVLAARTGDPSGVREQLDAARHLAAQTGDDTEVFWFGFGPTNVRVHHVMTLIELGDYDAAVKLGETVRFPSTWLPTRVGHHHFDMARAYHWMNRPDEALLHLQAARSAAPGQARRHPSVRATVASLIRAERHPSEALSRFAAWVGI